MKKIVLLVFFLLGIFICKAQEDAYYIKSFQFEGVKESVFPFFKLGTTIRFSFDNLLANEASYSYKITHCTPDWKKSNLNTNEYLSGINHVGFQDISNSFNTFQSYSHYTAQIPNQNQSIKISGNYILEIFNEENECVVTRKFIVYEELLPISLQVTRMRALKYINSKQNIKAVVDFQGFPLNQSQDYSLHIYQNGRFDIEKILTKPTYTIGNQLVYNFDEESSFWGGNEFLYIDNGDIRNTNNTIAKVKLNELFQSYIYTDVPQTQNYLFYEDINGAFYPYVKYKEPQVFDTEADYSWVYFTLDIPKQKQAVYLVGQFNNYEKNADFEMKYNEETKLYELALLLKQGFVNYTYEVGNDEDTMSDIRGSFAETRNVYHAFFYYKTSLDRYHRIIGMGIANNQVVK